MKGNLPKVRGEDDPAPWPCDSESTAKAEPGLGGPLVRTMRRFRQMSDAFDHMRAFVASRGHTSITELDTESRAALIIYLEGVLAQMEMERP